MPNVPALNAHWAAGAAALPANPAIGLLPPPRPTLPASRLRAPWLVALLPPARPACALWQPAPT